MPKTLMHPGSYKYAERDIYLESSLKHVSSVTVGLYFF